MTTDNVKIILIGSSWSGKTTLFCKLTRGYLPPTTTATIGIDFDSKRHIIDGKNVRIETWDTAGSEAYKSISALYYRKTDIAIILYDLTDETDEICKAIDFWLGELKKYEISDTVITYIVGNKRDSCDSKKCQTLHDLLLQEYGKYNILEISTREDSHEFLYNSLILKGVKEILNNKDRQINSNSTKSQPINSIPIHIPIPTKKHSINSIPIPTHVIKLSKDNPTGKIKLRHRRKHEHEHKDSCC